MMNMGLANTFKRAIDTSCKNYLGRIKKPDLTLAEYCLAIFKSFIVVFTLGCRINPNILNLMEP